MRDKKEQSGFFLLDSCVSHSQCAPWGERNDLDAVLAWLHDLGLLIFIVTGRQSDACKQA